MDQSKLLLRYASSGSLLVGLGIWEAAGRLLGLRYLPPVSDVMFRVYELFVAEGLLATINISIQNLLIALVIALPIALLVGVAMGMSWRVDAALGGTVNAIFTTPALVFVPIYFSLFGLSRWGIVALISHYTLFLVIVMTADAVRNPPGELLEMAQSFGASRWQLFKRISLPAATPTLLAALRLGTGRAVKGMINGEMFLAIVGLGSVVTDATRRFDSKSILAVLVVIVVIALALQQAIQTIDRRVASWLPRTQRT